jgi:hypothetical protein
MNTSGSLAPACETEDTPNTGNEPFERNTPSARAFGRPVTVKLFVSNGCAMIAWPCM